MFKMRLALPLLMIMVLAACSTLTVPKTVSQQIASGYVTVETLAETTAIAYRDGHIDAAEKARIKGDLNQTMEYLNLASTSTLGSEQTPESYMALAAEILNKIAAQLSEVPK